MSLSTEDRRARYVIRTWRLALVAAVAFAAVIVSYWHAQVVEGAAYRDLAENNRLRELEIPAPRGLILDRKGRALVENVPTYRLRLDSSRSTDLDESFSFASRILSQPVEELTRQANTQWSQSRLRPALVAESLSLGEVARFEAAALEHPEFEVEVLLRRFYRHGSQTAHLLGYIGEASRELVDQRSNLRPGDMVGIKGVERSYDSMLRGKKGRRVVVVDYRGKLVQEHLRVPAQRGEELRLTIDLDLQQEAARYFQGRVGSAVALDPRNGEILAMVSSPAYNPNIFARRLATSEWQELLAAANDPLQNRAVQNRYPPGSIFKMVTSIAGLEEGLVDDSFTVQCTGGARIYNHRYRCWKRGGHGRVDFRKAIQHSCDVYFYYLGQKLGIDRLASYARKWGLGTRTNIDIVGEKAGLVPDRQWSLRTRETMWFPGETISVAIGQGPLLTTPLQIAVLTAAIANGGRLVQPHIAQSAELEPTRQIDVDPATLEKLRDALWAAVNDGGTAAGVRIPGLDIAGKTGTAQVIRQIARIDSAELPFKHRDHAWFASFAPVHDPQLVVVVFVEHGGHGSSAAAPLAKRLYERHFGPLADGYDT